MQYALMEVDGCRLLLDGNELQVINNWESKPIKEQSGFNEDAHSHYLCYGGYLLNPDTSDINIHEKLTSMENFWLSSLDDYQQLFYQIAFYSIKLFPLIKVGHQRIIPFAALIKADHQVIVKINDGSGFAVTAFLRIDGWDVPTNILNREGIFAFNGVEIRTDESLNEICWRGFIDKDQAHRIAKDLIKCDKFNI